jgi:hypothetical protein
MFSMIPIRDVLDLTAPELDRIFVHGNVGRVLIAIGCSWTRGWGWHDHDMDFRDVTRQDDVKFVTQNSYVGHVAQHIGATGIINMAIPGSNNDMQTRLLVECLERNLEQFGQVFVLWGITSHLRWEMWSTIVNKPTMFMLGSKVPDHKEEERAWWLKYHFDDNFERQRLSQKILMIHGYLKNLKVDHLFFPTFTSYNQHNMLLNSITHDHYFRLGSYCNDMMSLMYLGQGEIPPDTWLSNPYSKEDRETISRLQHVGLMSNLAHPSLQGHAFIGRLLVSYLSHR